MGASKDSVMGSSHLRIMTVGIFLVGSIPLLLTPILPIIDFYNHLARCFVLSHIASSPYLQPYYQMHWTLLPDIGVDVIATPILSLIPPLIAGKIIAIGILAVLYAGALYFHDAFIGRKSPLIAVLLLPLLYSYIFNWGFANFLLGLGLAFWAAGWWLKHRSNPKLAVPISCIWSLIIFFAHGIAFMIYGVLVVSLELGLFWEVPGNKKADLVRSLLLVGVQALLPIAYFVFWKMGYAAGGEVGVLANLSPPPFSTRISRALAYHIKTIVRVEEGPAGWFDVTTLLVQIGAIWFMVRNGQISIPRRAWPLIAIAIFLAALPLPTLFGVGYISDRLPLFAALCLIGSLSIRSGGWSTKTRIISGILISLVIIRLGFIATSWEKYRQYYREFEFIAAQIPRGSLTETVMVGSGFHETNVPRCEMYGPLLIAEYGQIGPLFANEKQQPLAMIGPLKNAVDGTDVPARLLREVDNDSSRSVAIAAAAGFQYILICNTRLLKQSLPAGTTLVARTDNFALVRASRSAKMGATETKDFNN